MATPVGHYLLGFAVAEALARNDEERARSPWLAAVACVPDLDVVPGLLVGELGRFHQGPTHSLTAAVLFTAAVAVGLRWAGRVARGRLLVGVALLYTSHVALDWLTRDLSAPVGIPILWPWLDAVYKSPWLLLPHVQHTREPVVSAHNVLVMVRETVLFLPLVGLVQVLRRGARSWACRSAWLYGTWFVVAAAVSVASLQSS